MYLDCRWIPDLAACVHITYLIWFIITLPLRLSASGRRVNIIMLTNDTSFRPCSVSLYLSLPRKLIGPLDPSSPVRLMAATWSLPDRGWWRRWDCFLFCFTPIRQAGLALFSIYLSLLDCWSSLVIRPPILPSCLDFLSPPPCDQESHPSYHVRIQISIHTVIRQSDFKSLLGKVQIRSRPKGNASLSQLLLHGEFNK